MGTKGGLVGGFEWMHDIGAGDLGEIIGGHEGMDVVRRNGAIVKYARDGANWKALQREAQILERLSGTRLAPAMITLDVDEHVLYQSDMGDSEGITDAEAFRRAGIVWLAQLRSHGIRHGDLTPVNMVIRNNAFTAIDWQESHSFDEAAPQKQPWSDSYLLCRSIRDLTGDTPRVARRWMAVLSALGAAEHHDGNPLPLQGLRFVDYGCFQGDFPALAAAEGMEAWGIDRGGFRSGEDSIRIGAGLWGDMPHPPVLIKRDLIDSIVTPIADVTVCFSTWPYVVNEYGLARSEKWLAWVISHSCVLFFETQYTGDGPGMMPAENVPMLMERCGAESCEPIVTIPVVGRDASRTVWMVR